MGLDKQPPNKLRGGNYKKMAAPLPRGRRPSRCQPLCSCLPEAGSLQIKPSLPGGRVSVREVGRGGLGGHFVEEKK